MLPLAPSHRYAGWVNLKQLLPALAAVVAVFALACSGGDDDEPTPSVSPTVPGTIVTAASPTSVPSPSATLGTAPTATATPELTAEDQAENLKLLEVPTGMLQWVTDGPYVVPGDALGVFYLNIETQEIEGWYDLLGGTPPVSFSGEGRFSVFQRGEQVFRGGETYPAGVYLADRQSHLPYRWTGDAELVYEQTDLYSNNEITARGDLVLFRIPVAGGDDWFALLNARTNMVESTFQAEGQWGLISRDGSKIAIVGTDVSVVDVKDGTVEKLATDAFEDLIGPNEVGMEIGKWSNLDLSESADGDSFVIAVNASPPSTGGAWQRYEWSGDLLAKGNGSSVSVSPDGKYVAAAEAISIEDGSAFWHSYNVASTEDGEPEFRVVGVVKLTPGPNTTAGLPTTPASLCSRPPVRRSWRSATAASMTTWACPRLPMPTCSPSLTGLAALSAPSTLRATRSSASTSRAASATSSTHGAITATRYAF